MQRYNFQFTGAAVLPDRNGRLAGQVKDVAYQATTTDFWGSMEAVGGPQTYLLGGAFNCGKGQPGQVAAVSHGCPAAVFRGVNVLNSTQEAGAMTARPQEIVERALARLDRATGASCWSRSHERREPALGRNTLTTNGETRDGGVPSSRSSTCRRRPRAGVRHAQPPDVDARRARGAAEASPSSDGAAEDAQPTSSSGDGRLADWADAPGWRPARTSPTSRPSSARRSRPRAPRASSTSATPSRR